MMTQYSRNMFPKEYFYNKLLCLTEIYTLYELDKHIWMILMVG